MLYAHLGRCERTAVQGQYTQHLDSRDRQPLPAGDAVEAFGGEICKPHEVGQCLNPEGVGAGEQREEAFGEGQRFSHEVQLTCRSASTLGI